MSSNCVTILNSLAQVHLEIDFQIGDAETFEEWYDANLKDKNAHGSIIV
jgi:hypothetical protein